MERIMRHIGSFQSARWGRVEVYAATYTSNNALAIQLTDSDGEPLATLSVNMPGSENLPANCFYMKDWSENEELAEEARECKLFKPRPDLPSSVSGFVMADAYELVEGA